MNTRYFINQYIKLSINIRICFHLDKLYTRNCKVTLDSHFHCNSLRTQRNALR